MHLARQIAQRDGADLAVPGGQRQNGGVLAAASAPAHFISLCLMTGPTAPKSICPA